MVEVNFAILEDTITGDMVVIIKKYDLRDFYTKIHEK